MASRRNIQYNRLAVDDDDDYYGDGRRRPDPRFDYSPRALDRVPWKSICLALFLLALGCLVLLLSYFIFSGHMGGENEQAYGLLFIGIICILPGVVSAIFVSYTVTLVPYPSVFHYISQCADNKVSTRLGLHITLGGVLKATGSH